MTLTNIVNHYLDPSPYKNLSKKNVKIVSDMTHFPNESYFKDLDTKSLEDFRNLITRINNSSNYEEIKVIILENCFMIVFECKGYPYFFQPSKEELG